MGVVVGVALTGRLDYVTEARTAERSAASEVLQAKRLVALEVAELRLAFELTSEDGYPPAPEDFPMAIFRDKSDVLAKHLSAVEWTAVWLVYTQADQFRRMMLLVDSDRRLNAFMRRDARNLAGQADRLEKLLTDEDVRELNRAAGL